MARIKAIGVILLTYSIAVHIISKFSPLPFIGFGITLLAFPLALKLSIKELFVIELIEIVFALLLQIDYMLLNFSYISSFSHVLGNTFEIIFWYWLGAILMIFVLSISSALILKLLSRFTPKQIKAVLNEE